jgi:hypothetical protein
MNSIFMVAMNNRDPGNEFILGFYPTRELAEARKVQIETDPDWIDEDNESDVQVFVKEFQGITAEGLDTSYCLR